MNNFFHDCRTVEEIKKRYRQLAMKHHPDRGGDTATMQEINRQYQSALKHCDGQTNKGSDGKQHTYHYNEAAETELAEKIDELLKLKLAGIEIALIGLWIWITGDTKPHRQALKDAGCRWHSKRACWYWQNTGYVGRSKASLQELADKYGYKAYEFDDERRDAKKDKAKRIST